MVNRAVIILRYKEPALRWINEANQSSNSSQVTLADVNDNSTVYIIKDGAVESPEKFRRWLRKHFRSLFESELEGWYTDPQLWPSELTLKLFDAWFTVERYSVVLDTVGGLIEDDEL